MCLLGTEGRGGNSRSGIRSSKPKVVSLSSPFSPFKPISPPPLSPPTARTGSAFLPTFALKSMRHSLVIVLLFAAVSTARSETIIPDIFGYNESRSTENMKRNYMQLRNRLHPDQMPALRYYEFDAGNQGDIPADNRSAAIDARDDEELLQQFAARPGARVTHFTAYADEGHTLPFEMHYHWAETTDGIDILLEIKTGDHGLPRWFLHDSEIGACGANNTNTDYHFAPAFSEHMWWQREALNGFESMTGLAWVRRNNQWFNIAGGTKWSIVTHAQDKVKVWRKLRVDFLTEYGTAFFGPADKLPAIPGQNLTGYLMMDNGPLVRTSWDAEWVLGTYWENTAKVYTHCYADCMHTVFNIGNIPAHSRRLLRGKIYWFRGNLNDLQAKLARNFPESTGIECP